MRIHDHLDLPANTDLDTFITRLDDSSDRVRQSMRLFVLGEKVAERFDHFLSSIGERLESGMDVGRFVYGSFGSGKSHLLTILAKMLERDEELYDIGDPRLRRLRGRHSWLERHKVLVVKVNMMGKSTLASALYRAYQDALPPGTTPPAFTDEEKVFKQIETIAEATGGLDALLANIPTVKSRAFYDICRQGELEARLDLAAKLLSWLNQGEEPVRPESLWLPAREGFSRIARHARDLGYTAIAWLIDELIIWVREKDRASYIKQINDLSSLVDHDARRALPFLVSVAVQTDLSETCPEDISEKGFREQLGFIADRFRPMLILEDQDLFEVAARRVLRRKELDEEDKEEFEAAISGAFRKNKATIEALSGNLEPSQVRRLYPFQPALLRVLIDVTQALSRSRTAVAALYGLLAQYPDLKVGEFVPLGALWDILFTSDNVQVLRQNTRSAMSQRLADAAETYAQLSGKIEAAADGSVVASAELHQLVRSALLCQLSERPFFPDGRSLRERISASTLLRLNQKDIKTITERTGVAKVARLLRDLSSLAPQVHLEGEATDPVVRIKTEAVDIEGVLARARSQVQHADRFAYMRKLLIEQLGLELGNHNEGSFSVLWRGSRRKGRVKLCNVRTLSYAGQQSDFDPGKEELLILVDYPFDEEPGKSRQDDIELVQTARSRRRYFAMAWLPEHLSPAEMQALDNAAAIELIRKDKRAYFESYNAREADNIARGLEQFQAGRRAELEEAIRRCYFEKGLFEPLDATFGGLHPEGLDRGRAVETISRYILDFRYPRHPTFHRRLVMRDIAQISDWVVRAAVTGQPVDLKSSSELSLIEDFALPLELVYKGSNSITPRPDGRYLHPIVEWARQKKRFRAQELRAWLQAGGKEGFGFSEEVVQLFLYYLLMVEGFAGQQGGKILDKLACGQMPQDFDLIKGDVVEPIVWDQARRVTGTLLLLKGQADLPSPSEQHRLSQEARKKASELYREVKTLHEELRKVMRWAGAPLEGAARRDEVAALEGFLGELQSEALSHADRVRTLASLDGKDTLPIFTRLRGSLPRELQALKQIDQHKLAFERLSQLGSVEDRTAVGERLRRLLSDSVETSLLSELGKAWVEETEKRFRRYLDSQPVQIAVSMPAGSQAGSTPGGNLPHAASSSSRPAGEETSSPDALERREVTLHGLSRERIAEAVTRLLAEVPGERFTVRLIVEREE